MHETVATTIGWISTATLVLTLSAQIVRQWRSGSAPDVSPLLFVGQCAASLGFLVYSALVGSTVFVVPPWRAASESCTLALARLGSEPASGFAMLAPMPRRAQLRTW